MTRRAPAPRARRAKLTQSEINRRDAADECLEAVEALDQYFAAVRKSDRAIEAEKTMALTYIKLGMGE